MFFSDAIYVQIFADRFVVLNVESGVSSEVSRDQQFASPRMLVADFTMAEHQLKAVVKSVRRRLRRLHILIHPMERIEGGVTQIEYRVFMELGKGAGASRVGIHTGAVLPAEAVCKTIRDDKH